MYINYKVYDAYVHGHSNHVGYEVSRIQERGTQRFSS